MISVVIPAHNRVGMLHRAVLSVLKQQYTEFELIVIDDGSTEDMTAVQQLVVSKGARYVQMPHQGVSAARNYGALLGRGDWIAFLDSDDVWKPEKLSKQIAFHEENPELQWSQCEEIWYRHGRRVNRKQYHTMAEGNAFYDSLRRCSVSPSSVMINRKLFIVVGGFDETLPVCEDYELWLRLSLKYRVGLLHEPLIEKFGGHSDQLSKSEPAIDRFRLYGLIKLLSLESLSRKQTLAALDVIEKKATILMEGARKRGVYSESFYLEVIALAVDCRREPVNDLLRERWKRSLRRMIDKGILSSENQGLSPKVAVGM